MSLKDRIYAYFRNQPMKWIPSAQIERLVQEKTKYIASNASRQCRMLAQEGLLERQERPWKGKTLAWYRFNPGTTPQSMEKRMSDYFDSLPCCPLECVGGDKDSKLCKTLHP